MNIYIANYLSMYIFFSPAEFSSRCLFFHNTTNMKLKVASEFDMLQQNGTVQNVMIREIMLSLPNVNQLPMFIHVYVYRDFQDTK